MSFLQHSLTYKSFMTSEIMNPNVTLDSDLVCIISGMRHDTCIAWKQVKVKFLRKKERKKKTIISGWNITQSCLIWSLDFPLRCDLTHTCWSSHPDFLLRNLLNNPVCLWVRFRKWLFTSIEFHYINALN